MMILSDVISEAESYSRVYVTQIVNAVYYEKLLAFTI